MTNRLVLAGGGAFGRVVFSWIKTSPAFLQKAEIGEIVYIDDAEPQVQLNAPLISGISDYIPQEKDRVICTVGKPASRKIVVEKLLERNVLFQSFIHDSVVLAEDISIGEGTVLCPGVVVQPNVEIGDHVHIGSNCTVGHDTKVGEFVSLSPLVNLMSSIEVQDGVFFGGSSVILPGVVVASEAVVGAAAVVTKSVPESVLVTGVPGKWK